MGIFLKGGKYGIYLQFFLFVGVILVNGYGIWNGDRRMVAIVGHVVVWVALECGHVEEACWSGHGHSANFCGF